MSSRFLDELERRVVVLDGAMGTELSLRGLEAGACGALWNVERPDDVASIHKAYLDAGADAVLTNTFGASRPKLDYYELGDRTAEINRAAAALARKVAGNRFVLGDVGPTGVFIAPLGETTFDEMVSIFREQTAALVEGGADAIIVETMSDLQEVKAAITATNDVCDLPVVAGMTFARDASGTDFHTMMGVGIEQATITMMEAGADVVGTNCGGDIEQAVKIIERMASVVDVPLFAEPNAGMPRLAGERTVFDETPEHIAQRVPEVLNWGVRLIGSCCGTTPAHTAAIVRAVRECS